MDFEQMLSKLNEIADKLEDKNTSLEESFQLFDEGLKISSQCAEILKKYSERYEQLKAQWSALQGRVNQDE
ncbi:MAG: exodeoxyribonuclease VII small subunit [Clostridiales bacterium]|nr:exodeoxyribonuclease VII small subunit [Clostridiales bacterium]